MIWEATKTSLYDEEDIEGWIWTAEDGRTFTVIGDWTEPPPFDDERMPKP